MDWSTAFQIIWRTALQFGMTYLAARGSGADNTTALGAGGAAVLGAQFRGVKDTIEANK